MLPLLLALLIGSPEPTRPAPIGSPADWITDNDYPLEALRAHQQGTVRFELRLDETGKIASCEVTDSSGSAALDTATCNLISERGRFTPARDALGQPIADSYKNRVIWKIPQQHTDPLRPYSQVARGELSADGDFVSCAIVDNIGAAPDGTTLCDFLNAIPLSQRLRIRGQNGSGTVTVIAQADLAFEGDSFPPRYMRPDLTVVNVFAATFEVDAQGNSYDCKIARSEGVLAHPMPTAIDCSEVLEGGFDPNTGSGKPFPRKGSTLIAIAISAPLPATGTGGGAPSTP